MTEIKEALAELNPWWKGDFRLEYRRRSIYSDMERLMEQPQIIALTGLRRTGKTTLMMKIISDKLKSGTDPLDMLYFSFDEFTEFDIRDLISAYEHMTSRRLGEGRKILLLDEIQKLRNWNSMIKSLYDRYKGSVKIVVSGSESLNIMKNARETLGGRLFQLTVAPLSFREFLDFRSLKFEPPDLYHKELLSQYSEFLTTQGFPELVGVSDRYVIRKYLKESIVEKILFHDMPVIAKISDVSVLESIVSMMMSRPGQIVELVTLSRQIGVSRQTLARYLKYLEQSFILLKLYNYSGSVRKIERKLKKYYPAIVSPDLTFSTGDLERSQVFETSIVNQLRPEYFWRDPYKNEVDMVLQNSGPVPVEIKMHNWNPAGVLKFMQKFNVTKGYIVTADVENHFERGSFSVEIQHAFRFLMNRQAETADVGGRETEAFNPTDGNA